jgi:hypothetical protein
VDVAAGYKEQTEKVLTEKVKRVEKLRMKLNLKADKEADQSR